MAKIKMRLLTGLCSATVLFAGCDSRPTAADEASIHTNYVAFRESIIARDFSRAKFLAAYDYQNEVNEQKLAFRYDTLTNFDFALNAGAIVHHDLGRTNHAWFLPSSKINGLLYGFTKETNGWRINGELMPVQE